jgi:hypothetical protein
MEDQERTEETEHLDPGMVPPWLMEAAKNAGPDAMGWLVAGYLSGVNVGRKAGVCGDQRQVDILATCYLAYGHRGDHSTSAPLVWSDEPDESPGEVPHGE